MLFDSAITNIQNREVPFLFENIQSLKLTAEASARTRGANTMNQ
jgi:hypothetical protein